MKNPALRTVPEQTFREPVRLRKIPKRKNFPFEPARPFCYFLGQCQKVNKKRKPKLLDFVFLESFPYFFLDKKVTKNQDGSKRNFPLFGNCCRRSVLRRSKCCTDLSAVSLMRAYADFITALIFRSQAIFLIEADVRSKNRRLEKFILFGAQRLLLTLAFKISLIVLYKGYIIRPFGLQ